MRPKKIVWLPVAVFLLIGWSRPAMGAKWVADCKNMLYVADLSDLIVKGKVVKVQKQKDEKGQTLALVDIKVNKYLLGNGEPLIKVKQVLPQETASSNKEKTSKKNKASKSRNLSSVREGQEGYLYLVNSRERSEVGKIFQPTCDSGITSRKPSVIPQAIYYAP